MTEKHKSSGQLEEFWIDRFADRVSKSKLVKALFLGGTVASASQMAACTPPPPAEVAPISEASLSGVIGQESVDRLSGSSKIIVENSLAYISNKYAEDENFVPGTERIYAVAKGNDSFAYYFAGFKNPDGTVGLRVTDYCDSWVRDSENCQGIDKDLLMVEGQGNRLYGFIDEKNEQHPILLIDKDNNPTAFDINGSSYVERVVNSEGFLDKIVSIGAIRVQAAAPEATATSSPTATTEPTATKEPTVTPTEEEKGKYELNLDKFSNFPSSYEYLVDHMEEFMEAPDPFEDIDFFIKWWNEVIIPALGKREYREKNMIMRGGGPMGGFLDIAYYLGNNKQPLLGEPEFLYFVHKGTVYPMPVISVGYETDPHANFTMAIILYDGRGSIQGKGVLSQMSEGDKMEVLRIILEKHDVFPEEVNELIDLGLCGYGDLNIEPFVTMGVGSIKTESWREYLD